MGILVFSTRTMKLAYSLLASAVFAAKEPKSEGITYYLDALEAYCKDTYGIPAFRPIRGESESERKTKWENRCEKHRNRLNKYFYKTSKRFGQCGTFHPLVF